MQLLLKTQTDTEELEDDDPQISYLISAWARMCKIIGKDFVQYLPVVMPPVLKAAQIKPEVGLFDCKFQKIYILRSLLITCIRLLPIHTANVERFY